MEFLRFYVKRFGWKDVRSILIGVFVAQGLKALGWVPGGLWTGLVGGLVAFGCYKLFDNDQEVQ